MLRRCRFHNISLLCALHCGVLAFVASHTAAAECANSLRLSTCINANTFWPHPGPAHFQSVGGTGTTASWEFSLGIVTSYSRKPIVLRAESSNPNSADVPVLDHVISSNFLWGLGLTDRLELTLAMPITLYQTGTGISSFTSSEPQQVPGSSLGDIRFGAAYSFLPQPNPPPPNDALANRFSLAARFEVATPTGDSDWFAGDRSAVLIPSVAAEYRAGRFFFGAEIGARLRKSANLAGARVGSQGLFAFGAGYDVLPDNTLSVAIEAFGLPVLVGQESLSRDAYDGSIAVGKASSLLIPSEWMVTVRSVPTNGRSISFALSAGSALPLSESAMTAPAYRFVLGIRFVPQPEVSDQNAVLDFVGPQPDAKSVSTDVQPDRNSDQQDAQTNKDPCAIEAGATDSQGNSATCPEAGKPGVNAEPDLCQTEPDKCPSPDEANLTQFDGTTITFHNPQRFDNGSSRITPTLRNQLLAMARRARAVPHLLAIVVETYADAPGTSDNNENLAADRADAIRQVLLDAGLPNEKLTVAVGDLNTERAPTASQFDMTVQQGSSE